MHKLKLRNISAFSGSEFRGGSNKNQYFQTITGDSVLIASAESEKLGVTRRHLARKPGYCLRVYPEINEGFCGGIAESGKSSWTGLYTCLNTNFEDT